MFDVYIIDVWQKKASICDIVTGTMKSGLGHLGPTTRDTLEQNTSSREEHMLCFVYKIKKLG